MSNKNLPKVGVFYDIGSASPLTIKSASIDVCNLVLLYESRNLSANDKLQLQILNGQIELIDISMMSDEEILKHLTTVSALTTFSEYQLPQVAKFCKLLSLRGHSIKVVKALTDKSMQRSLLYKKGVSRIQNIIVHPDDTVDRFLKFNYPAILKPNTGAGSRWTTQVNSADEVVNALGKSSRDIEYVLEELLTRDDNISDKFYGDYVSVESAHYDGHTQQICVTAKLPLTKHYAETGMFLPSPFSEETQKAILLAESKAIAALGVREGITHTEIKLTPTGPEIIEVNGRLGGYVPELIKRSMGIDMVKVGLKLSLGINEKIDMIRSNKVVFQIFLTMPGNGQAVFEGVEGIIEIQKLDDVLSVQITKQIGDRMDLRFGTQSNYGIIYGASDNYESFQELISTVGEVVVPKLKKVSSFNE